MSLWLNNISSDDIGVVVSSYPTYFIPERKYNKYSVPGRNGDIVEQQYAWNNITVEYDVYLNGGNLPAATKRLAEWLNADGYMKITDSYNTDNFMLGFAEGSISVINKFNKFGKTTLRFNCKPQRFLNSGDAFIDIASGSTLTNPTMFASRPIIQLTASEGSISVGEYTIYIKSGYTGNMTIDCETMNAFNDSDNLNGYINCTEFPILVGDKVISYTGVSNVKVKPRWWTL